MRTISEIIIHCSATPAGKNYDVHDVDQWHRARGWQGVGYHYIILLDGTIQPGRPLDVVGAHCKGHNLHSIGICYIGGLALSGHNVGSNMLYWKPADTRTPAQRAALLYLVEKLKRQYPSATVHGHSEFANKACPCFDVRAEF